MDDNAKFLNQGLQIVYTKTILLLLGNTAYDVVYLVFQTWILVYKNQ